MEEHATQAFLLRDGTILLGFALALVLVFRRFGLGATLGYLLAGMIVGPHVPIPLVADEPTVHTLSELGVILLMFSLGLEFSVKELGTVRRIAYFGTPIQLLLTIKLGLLIGYGLGWDTTPALWFGSMIALSSTMVIL